MEASVDTEDRYPRALMEASVDTEVELKGVLRTWGGELYLLSRQVG